VSVLLPVLGFLGLLLAAVAVAFAVSRLARTRTHAALSVQPNWELLYTDQGEKRVALLSVSTEDAHLVGRPDRVYRIPGTKEAVIVEDKSRTKPPVLYDSHRMQLGAYVLLVEEHFGLRVTHALVRYRDGAFDVPVDDRLRETVRGLLREMAQVNPEHLFRNHEHPGRCRSCAYRQRCPQALG